MIIKSLFAALLSCIVMAGCHPGRSVVGVWKDDTGGTWTFSQDGTLKMSKRFGSVVVTMSADYREHPTYLEAGPAVASAKADDPSKQSAVNKYVANLPASNLGDQKIEWKSDDEIVLPQKSGPVIDLHRQKAN